MNRDEIRSALQRLKPQASREFQAEIEGFFGSWARGDASDSSDLDVLVCFGEHASIYELVGLGDFLEGVFHCKADVLRQRAIGRLGRKL